MGTKNTVTAGDYKTAVVGCKTVSKGKQEVFLLPVGFFTKKIPLNADTVSLYEVIGEESQTSAVSAVGRGYLGAALLGPVGLAAALSAKKKGIHTVSIQFTDGKSCILEVDKTMYQTIVLNLPKSDPIAANQSTDAASEIAKFKTLLDSGAITQEEYEAKKKQLLGL